MTFVLGEVACSDDCPSVDQVFNGYTDISSEKSEQCPKCEGTNLEQIEKCLEDPSDFDTDDAGTCVAEYWRIVTDGVIEAVYIDRYKYKKPSNFKPSFERTSFKGCSNYDFCNANILPETTTR